MLYVYSVYLFLSHGESVRFIVDEKYESKVKIGSSMGKRHIAATGKKRNLYKKYGNVCFIN